MRKKNLQRNKKGATSILVLFMMIVLISLGAHSIVSANVNYKLSQRVSDWSRNFYAMEEISEKIIMLVDETLLKSENEVLELVVLDKNKELVTERDLNKLKNLIEDKDEDGLDKLVQKIYNDKIFAELSKLESQYENLSVEKNGGNIYIEVDISSENESDMNLHMRLDISSFNNKLHFKDGDIVTEKDEDTERFYITERNQWQQPREFEENNMQLWDGSF